MATHVAPGLYFYEHLGKTGGTSWSLDIGKLDLLKHCGTSHLVGPSSVAELNATLVARTSSSYRTCNLFNRETVLATSVRIFELMGIEPRIILLLRQPVAHVRSMYIHCQGPSGFSRRRREAAGTFAPIGFADWLGLFDGRNGSSGGWRAGVPYCYYNPANYQSHLLVTPAGADGNRDDVFPGGRLRLPAAGLSQLRELLQRRAFFVGVTEHYVTSLCLLRHKLRAALGGGISSRDEASCSADTLNVSHIDHGNNAGSTTTLMTAEVLASIEAITQVDQLAYTFALARLDAEAERAGTSLFEPVAHVRDDSARGLQLE